MIPTHWNVRQLSLESAIGVKTENQGNGIDDAYSTDIRNTVNPAPSPRLPPSQQAKSQPSPRQSPKSNAKKFRKGMRVVKNTNSYQPRKKPTTPKDNENEKKECCDATQRTEEPCAPPTCRFCMVSSPVGSRTKLVNVDVLITPCSCSGSMSFVHVSCLVKWLKIRGLRRRGDKCEICGTALQIRVTPMSWWCVLTKQKFFNKEVIRTLSEHFIEWLIIFFFLAIIIRRGIAKFIQYLPRLPSAFRRLCRRLSRVIKNTNVLIPQRNEDVKGAWRRIRALCRLLTSPTLLLKLILNTAETLIDPEAFKRMWQKRPRMEEIIHSLRKFLTWLRVFTHWLFTKKGWRYLTDPKTTPGRCCIGIWATAFFMHYAYICATSLARLQEILETRRESFQKIQILDLPSKTYH